MNSEQKALIRQSFAVVETIQDAAAALFYGRLFELDPSVRPLFKADIKAQGRALMATLKVAVLSLDRLDQLVPTLQGLGRRHAGYGVVDAHYDTVATALLWTLEQGLGDQFTPECRQAWTDVYTLLALVMKEAAAHHLATTAAEHAPMARREGAPMSQRLPGSRGMPASRLPMSKRSPY